MVQELYKLPKGWAWFSVKKLSSKVQYGHTTKAREKGNAQFLRITDIQNGQIQWDGVPFVDVSDEELEKYRLHVDDLVFARSGATSGKSILIISPPSNSIFASYLIRVVPDINVVFPKFLELFFQSPIYWKQVGSNVSGAAQPNINGTKLSKFQVSLPPIGEQKRIVAKLDAIFTRIDTAIIHLQQTLELSKALFASALDEAFNGGDNVEKVTIKEIAKKIQYGHTAKARDIGNAQFLRITDIQKGVVDWSQVPYVSITENDLKKYSLNIHDIVFARSGATSGKSFLITSAPDNAIFASYLIRVVPNTEVIIPQFVYLYFQSPEYWGQVSSNVSGAAQPNINGTKLGGFKIPLPTINEQKRIVGTLMSYRSESAPSNPLPKKKLTTSPPSKPRCLMLLLKENYNDMDSTILRSCCL